MKSDVKKTTSRAILKFCITSSYRLFKIDGSIVVFFNLKINRSLSKL